MCLSRKFIVISLIIYAIYQFYQVYSSVKDVFVDYNHHYSKHIKFLAAFHIVGLMSSSILMIFGALKLKANLLIAALTFLLYKVGFIIWHFKSVYDITLGCEGSCDPSRLFKLYKHLLISGWLQRN